MSDTCCLLLHLILIMSGWNYYWESIAALQTKIDVRLPRRLSSHWLELTNAVVSLALENMCDKNTFVAQLWSCSAGHSLSHCTIHVNCKYYVYQVLLRNSIKCTYVLLILCQYLYFFLHLVSSKLFKKTSPLIFIHQYFIIYKSNHQVSILDISFCFLCFCLSLLKMLFKHLIVGIVLFRRSRAL